MALFDRRRVCCGAVLLAWAWSALLAAEAEPTSPDVPLITVLSRLDRVASLYRDHALDFTCDETITFFTETGPRHYDYRYVMAFDDDGRLADYRVRPGQIHPTQQDMAVLAQAYNWVFLFERDRWEHYSYAIEQRGEVMGRPAYRLSFEALPPYQANFNDWSGQIWVDAETYQPLQVLGLKVAEWDKREAFHQAVAQAKSEGRSHRSRHQFSEYTTDFGFEKNGMRFPSRVRFRDVRYKVYGTRKRSGYRESPLLRVHQDYENYRFYSVRTQSEVQEVVFGER